MPLVRVTERFAFGAGGRVRRDGPYPVIPGVLICGFESANNRGYKPTAWAGDRVKRYEGVDSFVNHANGERAAGDKLGWFENVAVRPDGKPVGDYCLNPKHPLAESVLWAAEHKPGFYGMSHVANCKTSRSPDGREMIEEVVEVLSVDLVANPATTTSLFESKGSAVKVKISKLIEWLASRTTFDKLARVKRLSEMDGYGDMEVSEPAAETDPDEAIKTAFKQAGYAVWDSLVDGDTDWNAAKAKLTDIAKAHGKIAGGDDKGGDESESEETPKEQESKAAKPDYGKAIREAADVCRKVGFKSPTVDDLEDIASAPADRRESLAKRLMGTAQAPAAGAEKPKSAGRAGAAKLESVAAGGGGSADDVLTWQD